MSMFAMSAIAAATDHYPLAGKYSYGTAGFRAVGAILPPCAFRIAFLMLLRSAKSLCGPVGIVVTASHNPASDNGLKLLSPGGLMLEAEWEKYANEVANANSGPDLIARLGAIETYEGISLAATSKCVVHVGADTRPSCAPIVAAIKKAVELCGATLMDHGIVSTPCLHFVVGMHESTDSSTPAPVPTPATYITQMIESFASIMKELGSNDSTLLDRGKRRPRHVIVDCANGVGALMLKQMVEKMRSHELPFVFHLVNQETDKTELLNLECGADYCQKSKCPVPAMAAVRSEILRGAVAAPTVAPKSAEADAQAASPAPASLASAVKVAEDDIGVYSIDGDADRVVAFDFISDSMTDARLLDGDRIIALLGEAIEHLVSCAQLSCRIGVVQTAYANGAATEYIAEELGLEVTLTPTGVKHLHAAAMAHDIGIYFEANGHGTALFDPVRMVHRLRQFVGRQQQSQSQGEGDEANTPASPRLLEGEGYRKLSRTSAAVVLLNLSRLLSQYCGDAIADILAIETALLLLRWTPHQWASVYKDLPSVQRKVPVPDPSAIATTWEETRIVTPESLQVKIDAIVERHGGEAERCRAFVRPSGTEPVVRVFAESSKASIAESMADEIEKAVIAICNGN